jgi:hypothetical protein
MKRLSGYAMVGTAVLIAATGCGRKSSLLLQRSATGSMEDVTAVGQQGAWVLEPATQTLEQGKVEVTLQHATPDYLAQMFQRREIFGEYAGKQPFFPENLVFYVKIANRSEERIFVDPTQFVLIDGRGNQYGIIGTDYINAIAEAKTPTATMTRGILEDASPGYFGFSVPVGKVLPKSQSRYALMQRSTVQKGYLYPGVVHDGLIAFWTPVRKTEGLTLLVTNIKSDFSADDLPQRSLEFPFKFKTTSQ